MNILILNGNDDPDKSFIDSSIMKFESKLKQSGHSVRNISLKDKKIGDCRGCFCCWVRTPGSCIIHDDMDTILREIIRSDAVILATNIEHYMVSPVLKAALDRRIPLFCAYIYINNGRMSHYPRYRISPKWMLLLEKTSEMTEKDTTAISYMLNRGNDNNDFLGTFAIASEMKEALNAINFN
jgi:multimeric flavodoxin WrbA